MTTAEKKSAHDAVTLRNFIELETLRREAKELRGQLSKLLVKPLDRNNQPEKQNV